MSEELFRLDLAQVERVRRLHERITRGLEMWDGYTRAVANEENVSDLERAGVDMTAVRRHQVEGLREEQGRVLSVLKAAVWNASEGLRSDHQKRSATRAAEASAVAEQDEVKE